MTLHEIQKVIGVKKGEKTTYYSYRSVDDVLRAIKPHLDSPLKINVRPEKIGELYFLIAEVSYEDVSVSAVVQPELSPKNMSKEQAFGAATSYVVKYALCNLFCIDNGEDSDRPTSKQATLPDYDRELEMALQSFGIFNSDQFLSWIKENKKASGMKELLKNIDQLAREYKGGISDKN